MKRRLLMIAAMCLSLTACGIDSSTAPAQQPDGQITEQTTSAVSVCKATVTEINGNTLFVKPVDGSLELSSADKFSLSTEYLEENITPSIGMVVEITYDGGVQETYPASFDRIQKVTVISEDSNAPLSNKGTLMNDLEFPTTTHNDWLMKISYILIFA